MLDELPKQIEVERRLLNRLLETHASLLSKCRDINPSPDELAAVAAVLHAFYTGIENIFSRVAKTLDGRVPTGPFFHSELIESMTHSKPWRPPLLSPDLSEILEEYLDFRHVFRHVYSFELKWTKMRHLAHDLEAVFRRFEAEIEAFLAKLAGMQEN